MSVRSAQPFPPGTRPTSAMREPWCDWARRHGLDPTRIPERAAIVCDDSARTITVPYLPEDRRSWPVAQQTTIQLEAPAAPFPAWAHLRAGGHYPDDTQEDQP